MGADASQLKGNSNALKNKDLNALSNLTPGYILKLKERFESGSEDYNLTKQGLKDFFKCRDNEVEVIFKLFDQDGNGSIDSYEFVCALSMMSHATLNEKAELIFNLYDFDRSQCISKDELTVLMTNVLSSLKNMEGKPAPTIAEIEQKTNQFFREADEDKNNQISLKEFKSYVKKDKQILEVLTSFGIAQKSDLGTDFGSGEASVPDVDSDLDEEINPKGMEDSARKQVVKTGERSEFDEEDLGEGDQATPGLSGVINNSIPDSYKPSRRDGEAPDASLDLEYIYGIRCHDVRNNLRYNADGKLVYNCAGVGVVMDKKNNTQQHFMSHRDDIHCCAIDPTGVFVATGEIGPKPRFCIWNSKTLEEVYSTQAPMTKGIKHVAFSRDGTKVACSDMHDDHNVFIFDVKTKLKSGQAWTPIAGGKGTRANIMSLGWNATSDVVIATAVKQVVFFTFADGKLRNQKGTGWGTTPADTVLCQAICGNNLFTGHHTGEIISWNGSSIAKRQKSHTAKVASLFTNDAGTVLISGGGDGIVSTWSVQGTTLTKIKDFNIKLPELMSMNASVTSVCESKSGDTLLVATRGGEIFEFNQSTGKAAVYLRGHFDLELWGLAVHPNQPEIYTWGQDAMLAVWDLKTRRQKKHCKLESGGDAIAFSNNAKFLVLGFINGTMLVLDANFGAVTKRRDRAGKAIQCIKFTPDDRICAAGGHDQLIMTYDVTRNFKPMRKLRGHSTTIWQMDFSLDSQTLIHDGLLFYDVATGKHNPRGASAFKNETWANWTLRQGWAVQGIFEPYTMVNDINGVDRSPDGQILATGDDFGSVKLFKYPSPVPKAQYQKFTGHSSHVTNVQFTRNKVGQPYLITTGGNDKCIFQWKYLCDADAIKANVEMEEMELKALDDGYASQAASTQASQAEPINEFDEEDLGDGDQALAVKAFLGQVKAMTPNGFKPSRTAGQAPDNNLKLKWAHGFRSFDTRGNLMYTSEGHVLFTTAGVGVVQNLSQNRQEFFNLHQEDIVAMALHPDKDIVATGQMAGKELNEKTVVKQTLGQAKGQQRGKTGKSSSQGKLVTIYIWRASTREVIAKIFGFHRRAIRQLAFSPSGKKLLSIGEDDQHSVAIYDWASQSKLCDASVDLAQVYDAKWSNDDNVFATCGVKHLKIFRQNGQTLQGSMCRSQGLPKGEQMTCLNYVLNNQLVTGSSSGQLIPWNGNAMGKPIKAHAEPIWVIEKGANNTFYTGSSDSKVILWNAQMQATKTIDIKAIVTWQPEAGLRSLDMKADGTLLVGTRGSDVLEVSPQGALLRKVVQGHFKGVRDLAEVWGCAVHPTEQIFATSGADMCVRLWQESKMVAVSQQLPFDATAVDWSSCGKFLAVGDRNGDCTIMDAKNLQVLGSSKSTLSGKKVAWVEDIKWSPDSTRIAFGSHGGNSKLNFVTVNAQGKPTKSEHSKVAISSALICLDWSQDGQVVCLNSQSYELLFIDANSKKMVNASSMKETQWQTWTCRFGFASQGIFPGVDYTDVNSVDRSRNGTLLATGDDFGMVKLFKYPCVIEKAESHEFAGHSSHVTKVKFSANDRYVVSTGGNDMTVMIWETDVNGSVQEEESQIPDYADDLDDPTLELKVDHARINREKAKIEQKAKEQAKLLAQKSQGKDFDEFAEQDMGDGDEFMAVRPWLGQMKPPTGFKRAAKGSNLAPAVELQLEWVHGYKGDCAKNNLSFLADGHLAYYIAALGIVYNPETHTQKFFDLHTDDITAMDFHPDNRLVASGENGKRPKAYIWDTQTMQMIHQFVGHGIVETIIAMAFSPSGKHLVLVAGNQDHNVAVYDTISGACVAESKGPREMVTQVRWENDQSFVMIGAKLFYQFTINAKSFTKKRANFGGHDQRIGSAAFNGNTCLTGAIDGSLYLWNGTAIVGAPKKLHARLIDAITVTDTHIFTGARDSKITVMNKQYAVLFTIDMSLIKDSNSTQVRAITLNARQDKMMVGTFGHEIIELPINMQTNSCNVAQAKILIHGHFAPMTTYTNEVWGLSIFPNQEKYATCSDDAKLKIWDTATHKQIKSIPLNLDKTGQPIPLDPTWKDLAPAAQGRAVDVSPKGDFIAVGMRDGTMRIFQTSTWKMVHMQKCGNEWIEDLKFSPDGKSLAVGAHDNKLYVFSMPDCKLRGKKFGASSSFITHLDWSLDSSFLRTTDGSYEILYYDVTNGKQLTSGATQFRDEPWATNSCVLGWGVQGIWQSCQDGSDINHCDRSHKPVVDSLQLVATADDSGKVNLYKYPSPVEKSNSVKGNGHSSHVTKVRFSPKDNYLFSTGGNDTAVMQWRIVVPK